MGSKLSQFRTPGGAGGSDLSSTVSPLSAQDASPVIAPADNLVIDGVPRCRPLSPATCGATPSRGAPSSLTGTLPAAKSSSPPASATRFSFTV